MKRSNSPAMQQPQELRTLLVEWYNQNKRNLPWRMNRNPYHIWISEVMLQQTTVAAVVPYFLKFIARFPNVKALASATESELMEYWAGLGYYSRARNIHRAAKLIAEKKEFPKTSAQLLELPGFGPYTSRAVASLAFSEKVGVLDGNVIRVLTRLHGLNVEWWQEKFKSHLQKLSDEMAQSELNAEINQGLMELGATVCTPKKPLCLLCPWKKQCQAFAHGLTEKIPLAKPKQQFQIWHWNLSPLIRNDNSIFLSPNTTTPFLKNLPFPIGKAQVKTERPSGFHIQHSVTKYKIFVTLKPKKIKALPKSSSKKGDELIAKNVGKWVKLDEVKKENPSSLMTKIVSWIERNYQ